MKSHLEFFKSKYKAFLYAIKKRVILFVIKRINRKRRMKFCSSQGLFSRGFKVNIEFGFSRILVKK